MIQIEASFKENANECRVAFLEASALQSARIATFNESDSRVDVSILYHPQYQHSLKNGSEERPKGLLVLARNVQEAAILLFSLHDEGWQEKFYASSLACVAYVLALDEATLDDQTIHTFAPDIAFIEVNLPEAIKNHASPGELISLARRSLFLAADAA